MTIESLREEKIAELRKKLEETFPDDEQKVQNIIGWYKIGFDCGAISQERIEMNEREGARNESI